MLVCALLLAPGALGVSVTPPGSAGLPPDASATPMSDVSQSKQLQQLGPAARLRQRSPTAWQATVSTEP
jgi:hypothetical protein